MCDAVTFRLYVWLALCWYLNGGVVVRVLCMRVSSGWNVCVCICVCVCVACENKSLESLVWCYFFRLCLIVFIRMLIVNIIIIITSISCFLLCSPFVISIVIRSEYIYWIDWDEMSKKSGIIIYLINTQVTARHHINIFKQQQNKKTESIFEASIWLKKW